MPARDPAYAWTEAPANGPAVLNAALLDNAATATTEGLWMPTGFGKSGSVEIAGSMSTVSVSLLGTNQIAEPLNEFTLTLGGSATATDTVTVELDNPNIAGGKATVTYTVAVSDTLTIIAAALAALIAQNTGFQGAGVVAQSVVAVITVSFPTIYPRGANDTPSYGTLFANQCTFSGSSLASGGGAGSETVTVAGVTTLGSAIGSAITALGITALTIVPRWLRARMTTLTGSGAFINANFNGPV